MSDVSPLGHLLNAFATAVDADLAISPMIVVGGPDDARPWIESVTDLARACGMRSIYYRLSDTDQVQDAIDWASSREDGDEDLRCIVLDVQGLGDGTLVDDALRHIRQDAEGEHIVVVVIDPDQLAETRQDIRTILGVEQALVPVAWQGTYPRKQEVRVVGTVTLAGKQHGRFFIAANVDAPYPHEVEIELDMGDRDEDAALRELSNLRPDRTFAVLGELRNGRIAARFEDVEWM